MLNRDIGLPFPCGIFGFDIRMIWILQDRLGSVPSFTFLMALNFRYILYQPKQPLFLRKLYRVSSHGLTFILTPFKYFLNTWKKYFHSFCFYRLLKVVLKCTMETNSLVSLVVNLP